MNNRLDGYQRRIVNAINPSWIRLGVYALILLTGVLFVIELLCHGIVGANPIQGSCRHFITLQFVEGATTLSFSLTAFLLVGVVVVSSFIVTETRRLNIRLDEFEIALDDGDGNGGGPKLTITYFENLETRDKSSSDSGLEIWSIIGNRFRISNRLRHRFEFVQIAEGSGSLELGGNRYAVRALGDDDVDPDIEGDYDYRIQGRIEQRDHLDQFEDRYYLDNENEQPRIHWLLREEERQLATIERQLRRAVTYSVSASLIGVLIQGYPWTVGGAPDPWLLGLSFPETIIYILASYSFTFVFFGMIHTSVGLLEVMAELLSR